MSDAPERIWTTKGEGGITGSWNATPSRMAEHMPCDWQTEYIRADKVQSLVDAAYRIALQDAESECQMDGKDWSDIEWIETPEDIMRLAEMESKE